MITNTKSNKYLDELFLKLEDSLNFAIADLKEIKHNTKSIDECLNLHIKTIETVIADIKKMSNE